MKNLFAFLFVFLFLIAAPANAWWNSTHSALAGKVCADFNCSCESEVAVGANIPDDVFKDFINHHCYNMSLECPESEDGMWKCPTRNHCPAYTKIDFWLEEAKKSAGCERWKDVAIASHYFFDTKVFWHNVQDENYFKCHEPFERKVNEKFLEGRKGWTVSQCGISVGYAEFEPWVREFEEKIGFEEKAEDAPLFQPCGWWCRVKNVITRYLVYNLPKLL